MTTISQQYLDALMEEGEEAFQMDEDNYDTFCFVLEEVY